MNRTNRFGVLLAGLMALNVALPVCAEGVTTATAPETTTQAPASEAPATTTTTTATAPEKKAQETASEATATSTPLATTVAEKDAKAPTLGWLQGLTNGLSNGFNTIKSFLVFKLMGDTEKVINGVEKAAVNFENAATKAGDAVTGAANEVKAGMAEVRGVFAGARQMLANGLAATKLDGLMSDESVKTLKEQAPLIFGVTVIGAALFAATWLYKAELQTLVKPLLEWLNKVAPAPAAQ